MGEGELLMLPDGMTAYERHLLEEKRKDQIVIDKISRADGKQLFTFMCRIRHHIGEAKKMDKFMRLCYQRAKEINKDRYGVWEHALVDFNHAPVPSGITHTTDLPPIYGYPVQFVPGENNSMMVMMNPASNTAVIRYTAGTLVSYEKAKKIFGS